MLSVGQYFDLLSIDKWTMIFNIINTLILYKIIKKFLFKPVNRMINERKSEIKKCYDKVENSLKEAKDLKQTYEIKMKKSNLEAMEIISDSKEKAILQSKQIINNAKEKANSLILQANQDIKLESEKTINDLKDQIIDLVLLIASEVIKKEINKEDNKKIIDQYFNEVSIE